MAVYCCGNKFPSSFFFFPQYQYLRRKQYSLLEGEEGGRGRAELFPNFGRLGSRTGLIISLSNRCRFSCCSPAVRVYRLCGHPVSSISSCCILRVASMECIQQEKEETRRFERLVAKLLEIWVAPRPAHTHPRQKVSDRNFLNLSSEKSTPKYVCRLGMKRRGMGIEQNADPFSRRKRSVN